MAQETIKLHGKYEPVGEWLSRRGIKSLMLCCGASSEKQETVRYIDDYTKAKGIKTVRFSGFTPNPLYEQAVKGAELFRENGCDAIIAVGGGSALDTAKCIRLFAGIEGSGADGAFLKQNASPAGIPFAAVPTTAGTGSEATRYAVIYYRGEKQSVTHEGCIPDTVFMDSTALKTLPPYHRKASMADALCHALESFWSVNSTDKSREYSAEAMKLILRYKDGYLRNTDEGNEGMLLAANIAGKAINITATAAGHAMCYKITGLFGCAHGHAALLCDRVLFRHLAENTDRCTDSRGKAYLERTLTETANAMGCADASEAAEKLCEIADSLELDIPKADEREFEILKSSVNPERLKNHPIRLTGEELDSLYHMILKNKA